MDQLQHLLWKQPDECRRIIAAALDRLGRDQVTVEDLAPAAFGVSNPSIAMRTQIGRAMGALGWKRIERRLAQPRYWWVRS